MNLQNAGAVSATYPTEQITSDDSVILRHSVLGDVAAEVVNPVHQNPYMCRSQEH